MGFDVTLIDCPPSLSLLTVNALVAAHSVLVPLQASFLRWKGCRSSADGARCAPFGQSDLRIEGVVLTMYDGRNNLAQQVETDARENLGEMVFTP
jgi:chromosome partitioning protein